MFWDRIWPLQMQMQVVPVRVNHARCQAAAQRQDALLDQALKDTFPASDPVSVARVN